MILGNFRLKTKFILNPKFSFHTRCNMTSHNMNTNATCYEIRQDFLDFFYKEQHDYRHSSSTIPHDDPTLLFANAGMNQFKPIFLGTVDPKTPMAKWKRAVNSQKCIRAGGKHNDLDDVGKDTYHHTFFEMLGSWSFGDYFKADSIRWAWELLTDRYQLPKDRLYATYFEGDLDQGLEPDEESRKIWQQFLPDDRIIPGNARDNFWEMGEIGPCGPCTEIHYDRIGGGRNCADLVNMDDPDVLEIWNLVFMQFNREPDRSLRTLPGQHVDTGMGLERIVSVIQDKRSNYDTDMFQPIFAAIRAKTGARAYQGKLGDEDEGGVDMAYRVLADHARTLTIALSDGGRPDNMGRGYVLRRILRRAVRYSQKLGAKPGDFATLVDTVGDILGDAFPEIRVNPDVVKEVINEEEKLFLRTLTRGQRVLERKISQLPAGADVLPGDIVWLMYDTFGFPKDLTSLIAEEKGMSIDIEGFENAKDKAIEISKQGGKTVDEAITLDIHALAELQDQNLPATDATPKYDYVWSETESTYELKSIEAKITRIRYDKKFHVTCPANTKCGVILDRTNFYSEQGGQINDVGFFTADENETFVVSDVQVKAGYALHTGTTVSEIKVGDTVTLQPDVAGYRHAVMNNHTCTHVLNHALRRVLGGEPDQKGSLVAPDRLRFDFVLSKAMTSEQVAATEKIVNEVIDADRQVFYRNVPLEEAMKIAGLRAMFGETYPDPVRVVSVGIPVEQMLEDNCVEGKNVSVEFCGGTHLHRTSHAQRFVIVSEEAIAKGIRRIIAVTGSDALKAVAQSEKIESQLKNICQVVEVKMKVETEEEIAANVAECLKLISGFTKDLDLSTIGCSSKDRLRDTLKKTKKTVDEKDKKMKQVRQKRCLDRVTDIAGESCDSNYIVLQLDDAMANGKVLNEALKTFKKLAPNLPVMLVSCDVSSGRICCSAQIPKAKSSTLKANEWVGHVSSVIHGKGGGKDVNAMASGTNVDAAQDCVELAEKFASVKLSSL